MKFDLKRLESLVDLMETRELGELELMDGQNFVAIERALNKKPSQSERGEVIDEGKVIVTSPRVGIFLTKASAGEKVKAGAPLGELRVMDVKYAVNAPISGTIEELFVEAGMGVEYGQALMKIVSESVL